jgi:hypothetical protein
MSRITPGGNPVCDTCGHWYIGVHLCPVIQLAESMQPTASTHDMDCVVALYKDPIQNCTCAVWPTLTRAAGRLLADPSEPHHSEFIEKVRKKAEAKVLREFAHHDLHGLIPHSEISDRWYHGGLDSAQREALHWAEARDGIEEED